MWPRALSKAARKEASSMFMWKRSGISRTLFRAISMTIASPSAQVWMKLISYRFTGSTINSTPACSATSAQRSRQLKYLCFAVSQVSPSWISPPAPAVFRLPGERRRQADHADDAIHGRLADLRFRVCEIQVIGGEDLPGGNAGDLETGRRKAPFHSRHIDFIGSQQRQLHPVVAEARGPVHTVAEVVAQHYERAGQSRGAGDRDADLHAGSAATSAIASASIWPAEMPCLRIRPAQSPDSAKVSWMPIIRMRAGARRASVSATALPRPP